MNKLFVHDNSKFLLDESLDGIGERKRMTIFKVLNKARNCFSRKIYLAKNSISSGKLLTAIVPFLTFPKP